MKFRTRVLYVSSFPLFSSSYWSIAGTKEACWKHQMKKPSWTACVVFTPTSQRSRVILASWLWEEKKHTVDMQSFLETCYPRNKLFFGSLPENIMSIEHIHNKGQLEYIHFLRACLLQPLFFSIYQYLLVLAFERN